jgi:hypothetical protein
VGVGIAVVVALNWDRTGIDRTTDKNSLGQDLEKEFGSPPLVEFECIFPVVGVAPCILDSDSGRREVRLTFTNYELPGGISPEEQARRIALLSFEVSEFVKHSDKTEVIFENIGSGESGNFSQTSKYSFDRDELAAVVAP